MHSPFTIGEELVALDTGLVDVGHSLTCDKADEVGGDIQEEMDGQAYTDCSIKRSKQISTLQSMYASVNVGTEKVTIDPLTCSFISLCLWKENQKMKSSTTSDTKWRLIQWHCSKMGSCVRPKSQS